MSDENINIPFQIQNLVSGMNDTKNNQHIRANFRATLLSIQQYLERETKKFDIEMGTYIPPKKEVRRNGRR